MRLRSPCLPLHFLIGRSIPASRTMRPSRADVACLQSKGPSDLNVWGVRYAQELEYCGIH